MILQVQAIRASQRTTMHAMSTPAQRCDRGGRPCGSFVCDVLCNAAPPKSAVIHLRHMLNAWRRPELLLVGNVTIDHVEGKRALVIPASARILCDMNLSRSRPPGQWDVPQCNAIIEESALWRCMAAAACHRGHDDISWTHCAGRSCGLRGGSGKCATHQSVYCHG